MTRLLLALPGAAGRFLTDRTERGLAGTNPRYKSGELPLAEVGAGFFRQRRLQHFTGIYSCQLLPFAIFVVHPHIGKRLERAPKSFL